MKKMLLGEMKVLRSSWDNAFLLSKIILILTINANIILGIRILPLYKQIEGSVIEIVKNGSYTLTNIGGADRPSNCMYLKIDSYNSRVIHSKNEYADLFSIGDKVKVWVYKQHGEYQIVKAQRGQEVLIEHNDVWATIVFVLMVGSLAIVLFEIVVKKVLPKRKGR
ncbi:hypothetical protein [Marinilabilia salmonicolor]|uniref:hypothetical protein n=1 Tax=Marinilabilia salmonicolor TaxID=989 RepID=UPI00029AAAD4|nr:hypothetical protein [Marinilabilia salmonicolor]